MPNIQENIRVKKYALIRQAINIKSELSEFIADGRFKPTSRITKILSHPKEYRGVFLARSLYWELRDISNDEAQDTINRSYAKTASGDIAGKYFDLSHYLTDIIQKGYMPYGIELEYIKDDRTIVNFPMIWEPLTNLSNIKEVEGNVIRQAWSSRRDIFENHNGHITLLGEAPNISYYSLYFNSTNSYEFISIPFSDAEISVREKFHLSNNDCTAIIHFLNHKFNWVTN